MPDQRVETIDVLNECQREMECAKGMFHHYKKIIYRFSSLTAIIKKRRSNHAVTLLLRDEILNILTLPLSEAFRTKVWRDGPYNHYMDNNQEYKDASRMAEVFINDLKMKELYAHISARTATFDIQATYYDVATSQKIIMDWLKHQFPQDGSYFSPNEFYF